MQTITRRAPEGAMRRVCPEMYATRLFLLCCMMYIIGVFGRMSYSAVAVELITSEGFTKSQAGLIGTALFAAYGACQILSGFLGDKIPPRKMVFAGVFGSAVLNFGMGIADDYRGMLVLWAANGVFQSFIWAAGVQSVFRGSAAQLPQACVRERGGNQPNRHGADLSVCGVRPACAGLAVGVPAVGRADGRGVVLLAAPHGVV